LKTLTDAEAATFVEGKLPTSKSIRSGDLGEILATEWIATQGGYQVPIKRLRWKDHRNMAMRGDDVIGIQQNPQAGGLQFLKTEAKSRVALSSAVVTEARAGLDKDGGLPSAHALSFIADRLADLGNDALSDAILDAQLKTGIQPQQVRHLLFTFSGNNPETHLTGSLRTYAGDLPVEKLRLLVIDDRCRERHVIGAVGKCAISARKLTMALRIGRRPEGGAVGWVQQPEALAFIPPPLRKRPSPPLRHRFCVREDQFPILIEACSAL
jgi:hypothetical protein